MNLSNSYFAIPNLLLPLERWANRYCYHQFVMLEGRRIEVSWTKRAEKALMQRQQPLLVEMQLYFSCVVKKRVLFHDHADFETITVNDCMRLAYRPLQSAACDPETFARDYPAQKQLASKAAMKMLPSRLDIDFRRGQWLGELNYGAAI